MVFEPILHANGPYDLKRSLKRIVCAVVATRHPEMGERAVPLEGDEFPLALRVAGSPMLLGLSQEGSGSVRLRVLAGHLKPSQPAPLLADIRRILCLDHDLEAFYKAVKGDRPLHQLTKQYQGLRPVLTPTVFQALIHAIIFQQISYPAAQTVENRLMVRYGEQITYGDRTFPLFPTPERLAALDSQTLRTSGIPPRKAQAILEVARETLTGTLKLDELAAMSDARAVANRLMRIPGIGPWTAHHVIIRGMGLTDCLPFEDPGLRRAIAKLYEIPTLSARQIAARAEAWRPWRSYVTYYLWNSFWR